MFEHYLQADDYHGAEYGRCASLLDGMRDALRQLPAAAPESPLHEIDEAFADAPVPPTYLCRNAMEHALVNLCHVVDIVDQSGRKVSVAALMGNIRIALLAASHLCCVTSAVDSDKRLQYMGVLYRLETESAAKFIAKLDAHKPDVLTGLRPQPNCAVRQLASYVSPYPPPRKLATESALLTHMKRRVLGPLLTQLSIDESHGDLLIDHLFNTTSGAAHGYGWIDLDGVVCQFVPQFSCAVMVVNIVFNDYLRALGHHPTAGKRVSG